MEHRFYEQGEDDPGVDALRAAAEESFEELRTELPDIAEELEKQIAEELEQPIVHDVTDWPDEALAALNQGIASGGPDLFEEEEDEEAPLTHEEWEGAQKSALVEEGHLTPEEAFGGDRIGDAVERLKPFQRYKIKNVYDKPEFPVDAVDILEPDFEYADWAEDRVSQLWKRRLG